jgi:two-component system CheB/CheR fusion protein
MARVLLVDDDAAGLDLRRLILERDGYEVRMATNPFYARTLFMEFKPQIVVLDLRLPEPEDGLSLIRDFRAADPRVRIIALSGYTPDLENKPEASLVDQILEKPVRAERLFSALAGTRPTD